MQLETPLDVIVERGVIKSQNVIEIFGGSSEQRNGHCLTAFLGVNLAESGQDRKIDR